MVLPCCIVKLTALSALTLDFGVEQVLVSLVVLGVPLSSFFRSVPLCCCIKRLFREGTIMPSLVVRHVLRSVNQLKIFWRVVGFVVVDVVNVVPFWDFSIEVCPDCSVKALAIALEVVSAEIVPLSEELLLSRGDTDNGGLV